MNMMRAFVLISVLGVFLHFCWFACLLVCWPIDFDY